MTSCALLSGSDWAGHRCWSWCCPSVQTVQPAQVLPPHHQVYEVTQWIWDTSNLNYLITKDNWCKHSHCWGGANISLSLIIFSSIIGTCAVSLLVTLEEMHILGKKMFFNSLSLHASRLMDKVHKKWDDFNLNSFYNSYCAALWEGRITLNYLNPAMK